MSRGRMWITRSALDAPKSAKAWQAAGFDTITAPLVEIAPPPDMPPILPRQADVIVTSRNALYALEKLTDDRHWPIWAVGAATATLAREMGFPVKGQGKGTGQALLELMLKRLSSEDGPFIHISGQSIRLDIAKALRDNGWSARRDVYYANSPAISLPDIDLKDVSHIALYSNMAAQALAALSANLSHVSAISISPAVDHALRDVDLAQRKIAVRPAESAMITTLCA